MNKVGLDMRLKACSFPGFPQLLSQKVLEVNLYENDLGIFVKNRLHR